MNTSHARLRVHNAKKLHRKISFIWDIQEKRIFHWNQNRINLKVFQFIKFNHRSANKIKTSHYPLRLRSHKQKAREKSASFLQITKTRKLIDGIENRIPLNFFTSEKCNDRSGIKIKTSHARIGARTQGQTTRKQNHLEQMTKTETTKA